MQLPPPPRCSAAPPHGAKANKAQREALPHAGAVPSPPGKAVAPPANQTALPRAHRSPVPHHICFSQPGLIITLHMWARAKEGQRCCATLVNASPSQRGFLSYHRDLQFSLLLENTSISQQHEANSLPCRLQLDFTTFYYTGLPILMHWQFHFLCAVCVFELTPQHAAKQTREEGGKKEGGRRGKVDQPRGNVALPWRLSFCFLSSPNKGI